MAKWRILFGRADHGSAHTSRSAWWRIDPRPRRANSGALAELVREGLPVKALFLLAEAAATCAKPKFRRRSAFPSARSRGDWRSHSRLTAAESDRTVRLAQVYSTAVDTLGDEEKAAAVAQDSQSRPARRPSARPARHRSRRARSRGRAGPHRLWRLQLMRIWRLCRAALRGRGLQRRWRAALRRTMELARRTNGLCIDHRWRWRPSSSLSISNRTWRRRSGFYRCNAA